MYIYTHTMPSKLQLQLRFVTRIKEFKWFIIGHLEMVGGSTRHVASGVGTGLVVVGDGPLWLGT